MENVWNRDSVPLICAHCAHSDTRGGWTHGPYIIEEVLDLKNKALPVRLC